MMAYYFYARDTGSPLLHPGAYAIGMMHPKIKEMLGSLHQSFEDFRERELNFAFDEDDFRAEEKKMLVFLADHKNFEMIVSESLKSIKELQKMALSFKGVDFRT